MTRADEIRTRAEKATPGPWKITWPSEEVEDADGRLVAADARQNSDNTEFIAHAREDIPWLLAERDRLTEALTEYASHQSWRCEYRTRYKECLCGLDDLMAELGLDAVSVNDPEAALAVSLKEADDV